MIDFFFSNLKPKQSDALLSLHPILFCLVFRVCLILYICQNNILTLIDIFILKCTKYAVIWRLQALRHKSIRILPITSLVLFTLPLAASYLGVIYIYFKENKFVCMNFLKYFSYCNIWYNCLGHYSKFQNRNVWSS